MYSLNSVKLRFYGNKYIILFKYTTSRVLWYWRHTNSHHLETVNNNWNESKLWLLLGVSVRFVPNFSWISIVVFGRSKAKRHKLLIYTSIFFNNRAVRQWKRINIMIKLITKLICLNKLWDRWKAIQYKTYKPITNLP